MFDLEEDFKEFPIIVATGLLGYLWLSQYSPKDAPYVPPTKEQVVWEYQNVPLFNRTVDTIVSHLRHRLLTNAMHSDSEGHAILENVEYDLEYVDSETIRLTRCQ